MSAASRRYRRRAARRRAVTVLNPRRASGDGFWVAVPTGTDLQAWESGIRADPALTDDERTVGLALAAVLRGVK